MGHGKHKRSRGGNSNRGETSRTDNLERYNLLLFPFGSGFSLWSTNYDFVEIAGKMSRFLVIKVLKSKLIDGWLFDRL